MHGVRLLGRALLSPTRLRGCCVAAVHASQYRRVMFRSYKYAMGFCGRSGVWSPTRNFSIILTVYETTVTHWQPERSLNVRCRQFILRHCPQEAQQDIAQLNDFLYQVQVYTIQSAGVDAGSWSILVFYEEATSRDRSRSVPQQWGRGDIPTPPLTEEERAIYTQLRAWRMRRAQRSGQPAELMVNDTLLRTIARQHMSLNAATRLNLDNE